MGQFILDFACASLKLGIEIDGSIHKGHEAQDAARSEWLRQYGWTILRFSNDALLTNLKAVLQSISDTTDTLSEPHPLPQ